MKKAVLVSRILLGLVFFVFGLNGFLNFMPMPPLEEGPVKNFMMGLMGSGYFFPFLKATEVICGAMLLTGFFVPLACLILAPIVLNIVLYHRLFAGGPPSDLIWLVLLIIVMWGNREVFAPLLKPKSKTGLL